VTTVRHPSGHKQGLHSELLSQEPDETVIEKELSRITDMLKAGLDRYHVLYATVEKLYVQGELKAWHSL
jgi:hypothetical protein